MRCVVWYHLYKLKNVKNTHGGVLFLVKWQVKVCKKKKTWTLKNMNPGKYGLNMGGIRKKVNFRELCFINKDHAQCDLMFKSSQISKLNFSG